MKHEKVFPIMALDTWYRYWCSNVFEYDFLCCDGWSIIVMDDPSWIDLMHEHMNCEGIHFSDDACGMIIRAPKAILNRSENSENTVQ